MDGKIDYRKRCFTIDDQFLRSPLGLVKFISMWTTIGSAILFCLATPGEHRQSLIFFLVVYSNSVIGLVTLTSCVHYGNRGVYLEPMWHFVVMLLQIGLVILFYFTAFQPFTSYIKAIPSWQIFDESNELSIKDWFDTVCLIMMLISAGVNLLFLVQFGCLVIQGQRGHYIISFNSRDPDDQLTQIEEVNDIDNLRSSCYVAAHLPGDTLTHTGRHGRENRFKDSMASKNWDIVPCPLSLDKSERNRYPDASSMGNSLSECSFKPNSDIDNRLVFN